MRDAAQTAPRPLRRFGGLAILAGLAVGFLIAALTVFVLLVKHQQDVRASIQEDALWATYQLDREAHKLIRSVEDVRRDGPSALAAMSTRFDILYSRVDLLRKGAYPEALKSNPYYGVGLQAVTGEVARMTPLFDRINAGEMPDAATLDAVSRTFESLLRTTEKMVSSVNAKLSEIRTENRNYQIRLYQILAGLVAALTVTMGGVITVLIRQIDEVMSSRTKLEVMARDLAAAAEAAEAGNRAKSTFLATMSHEIRTPINGVVGMTDLLMDTSLTAEQTGFAQTIRSCGLTLVELIDDVLDFSKLEAGSFDIDDVPFDAVGEVERAIRIVEQRGKEKGITVVLAPAADVAALYRGDPARLRQIVLNFLSNAVKFTETGTVVARVSDVERDGRCLLRMEVEDTGIGIPESGRARLFQEFNQVDASITRRFGGTGLGLAISKRIVARLGGQIGFESEEGAGTVFWCELPTERLEGERPLGVLDGRTVAVVARSSLEGAAIETLARYVGGRPGNDLDTADLEIRIGEDDLGRASVSFHCRSRGCLGLFGRDEAALVPGLFANLGTLAGAAVEPGTLPTTVGVRGLSILLAEDNRVNQEVAKRILERLGHTVAIANNGAEALAMTAARSFDLVLMDMQMPVMDGLEATRAIRKSDARTRSIPIVAMTANAFTTDRDACLSAGMNAFLTKPVDRAKIAGAIDAIFQGAARPEVPPFGDARPAGPSPEAPGISEKRLRSLIDEVGADGVSFLLTTFLEDATALLGDLSTALSTNDAPMIRRSLHTLKGAAANVGCDRIADLASRLMADPTPDIVLISQLVLEVSNADATVRTLKERLALSDAA